MNGGEYEPHGLWQFQEVYRGLHVNGAHFNKFQSNLL